MSNQGSFAAHLGGLASPSASWLAGGRPLWRGSLPGTVVSVDYGGARRPGLSFPSTMEGLAARDCRFRRLWRGSPPGTVVSVDYGGARRPGLSFPSTMEGPPALANAPIVARKPPRRRGRSSTSAAPQTSAAALGCAAALRIQARPALVVTKIVTSTETKRLVTSLFRPYPACPPCSCEGEPAPYGPRPAGKRRFTRAR